jgi:SAM-dependent methyltransferase
LSKEAELIGIKVGLDQLQVICNRYYFAGQFVTDKAVLEVGCGSGIGLGYLNQNAESIIGGDYANDNLNMARQYCLNIPLIQLDAHYLPFRNKSFDVIVAMATIIYLDLDKFFAECHRLLEAGGILAFCTPNKDQPHFQPSGESRHYYSVPELSLRVGRYFNAEFFGMFPVLAPNKWLISKTKNSAIAIGSHLASLLPKNNTIKSILHGVANDITLTPEVLEHNLYSQAHMQFIPQTIPDSTHRVIYAKCTSREDI